MKKICSCILSAVVLMIGAVSIPSMSASAQGIKDLDGNGSYTVADAVLLARYIGGSIDYGGILTDLDVTGNYVVDQVDLTAYLRYLAGLSY